MREITGDLEAEKRRRLELEKEVARLRACVHQLREHVHELKSEGGRGPLLDSLVTPRIVGLLASATNVR